MGKQNFVIVLFFLVVIVACDKDVVPAVDPCLERLETEFEILEEDHQECIFNDVYSYQDEIYTVYNCCVCDLIIMAIDCSEEALCDFDENCMEHFFQNAIYLFSLSVE